MKTSILGFILFSVLALPSCSTYLELSGQTNKRDDISALPKNFSLLDLGRTLSQGRVDIFDPWLDALSLPSDTLEQKIETPLTFPEHPFMLVRDESVTVFTLKDANSPAYSKFFNIMEGDVLEIPSAVPLIEDEPLLP